MGWLTQRVTSFGHALNGLKVLLLEEHHAQLHLLATGLVIGAGLVLGLLIFLPYLA